MPQLEAAASNPTTDLKAWRHDHEWRQMIEMLDGYFLARAAEYVVFCLRLPNGKLVKWK